MTAIAVQPETKLITGEELLAMSDIGPAELIDGRIVSLTPTGFEHGDIEFTLGTELKQFVSARNLGWVIGGEVGIYIHRNPDRIRAADIAFVSKQRTAQRPPHGYLELAPELVVEIISPSDLWQGVREKIQDYFSTGVERVWIVEPDNRAVLVYRNSTEAQELHEGDTLHGEGILAAFALPVADLFSE